MPKEKELSPLACAILRIMEPLHKGKQNAIPGRELFRRVKQELCYMPYMKLTDRQIRETFELLGQKGK